MLFRHVIIDPYSYHRIRAQTITEYNDRFLIFRKIVCDSVTWVTYGPTTDNAPTFTRFENIVDFYDLNFFISKTAKMHITQLVFLLQTELLRLYNLVL